MTSPGVTILSILRSFTVLYFVYLFIYLFKLRVHLVRLITS